MTGKEILEEEFEKAGMRGGYKAEQVDSFLEKIAAYVDEINTEKSDLNYKIQILADKIEEYKADEENIRDALLGAQKLGTSILNEAKSKAEGIAREAKTNSENMMAQARAKVDTMTKESLEKANRELTAIKREHAMEQKRLDMMKQEVSNFRATVLKQYKTHLDLLSNLPVEDMQAEQEMVQKAVIPEEPAEPEMTKPVQEEAQVPAASIEEEERGQTREFPNDSSTEAEEIPALGAKGHSSSYIEKFAGLDKEFGRHNG